MRMFITQSYEITAATSALRKELPLRVADSSGNAPHGNALAVRGDTIAVLRASGSQVYVAFDRDPTAADYDFLCLGNTLPTIAGIPPHARFVSFLASTGTNLTAVNVGFWTT